MSDRAWNFAYVSGCVLTAVAVMLFLVVLHGCKDNCDPTDTKCEGGDVFVCNADERWELEADCSKTEDFGLNMEWVCCYSTGIESHVCLPKEACDGGVQ